MTKFLKDKIRIEIIFPVDFFASTYHELSISYFFGGFGGSQTNPMLNQHQAVEKTSKKRRKNTDFTDFSNFEAKCCGEKRFFREFFLRSRLNIKQK